YPTPLPNIQPRPPLASATPAAGPPGSELAPRSSPFEPTKSAPRRGPGRPTNKEIARREAEAAAKGTVYIRSTRKKPQKPKEPADSPLPPAPAAAVVAPAEASFASTRTPPRQTNDPAQEQSSSSGKRKRQRLIDQSKKDDAHQQIDTLVATPVGEDA